MLRLRPHTLSGFIVLLNKIAFFTNKAIYFEQSTQIQATVHGLPKTQRLRPTTVYGPSAKPDHAATHVQLYVLGASPGVQVPW
jgi:hypothetical protein